MSLVTLEVEIQNGRLISRGPEPVPHNGVGLLTLLPVAQRDTSHSGSVGQFIENWAGAFTIPAATDTVEDSRLAYLIGKHMK